MTVDTHALIQRIKDQMSDAQVHVEDLREDGQHYALYVVSSAFAGKSRVDQHRMIHKALEGLDIQALSIQTSEPKR